MVERVGVRARGECDCDLFIPAAIEINQALQKLTTNGLQQEILTQAKLAEITLYLKNKFNYEIGFQLLGEFAGLLVDYQVVSKRWNFTDVTGQDYTICIAADKTGEFLVVVRRVR
jgi:hypothetical protein